MFITTRVSLSICLLLTSLLVVQCQDDEFFVAQEDWQEIREGQKVPGGLHYRMNLETGKKEAKLLSLEDTDSGKGIRLQMCRKDIEHLYHAFMCSPVYTSFRYLSNTCNAFIFEKLIFHQILQVEKTSNADITGNSQHGFKRKQSTCTAGLVIQSVIAHTVDNDDYALMANLNLSAAFDTVNVKLLLKRLGIVGLPEDLIELISGFQHDTIV